MVSPVQKWAAELNAILMVGSPKGVPMQRDGHLLRAYQGPGLPGRGPAFLILLPLAAVAAALLPFPALRLPCRTGIACQTGANALFLSKISQQITSKMNQPSLGEFGSWLVMLQNFSFKEVRNHLTKLLFHPDEILSPYPMKQEALNLPR